MHIGNPAAAHIRYGGTNIFFASDTSNYIRSNGSSLDFYCDGTVTIKLNGSTGDATFGETTASHANMFVYLKKQAGQELGSGFTYDSKGYVINPEGNKVPTGYLSVSNAWKSSVTECQKKAFNSYMNIADDVYRNVDVSLDEAERKEFIEIIQPINSNWLLEEYGETIESMNDKIVSGVINKSNVNASRKKMNLIRDDWDEKGEQWEKDNQSK